MNLPEALLSERRFVCFNNRKNPINPRTGQLASSANPRTWASYPEALAGVDRYKLAGIGFMLGGGFAGVDLDTCRDKETGQLSEEAAHIIRVLDSYTEVSISGTGTHTLLRVSEELRLPFHKKKMKPNGILRPDIDGITGLQRMDKQGNLLFKDPTIEIYTEKRFFILTGTCCGDCHTVNERTDALRQVLATFDPRPSAPALAVESEAMIPMDPSIEKALKLDPVFQQYWNGDRPNQDESADDYALLGKLLYWCNAHIPTALHYFRESPHAQQKDELHQHKMNREDYLLRTAAAAMPASSAAIDHQHWERRRLLAPYRHSHSSAQLQQKLQELQPHTRYSYDDKGNGELFADVYGDVARFNTTVNEWYVYSGIVWQKDAGGMAVSRMAKQLKDELLLYSLGIENESQQKVYQKHVIKWGSRAVRDILLKDARDKHPITNRDLDNRPNLLNCPNGTLDLVTFEFRPHNPADLLSKVTRAAYQPQLTSQLWESFICEVMQGDAEKSWHLQKACGYSITDDVSQETCFILYGATTRNGKSTLTEALMVALGGSSGYSLQMKPESLAQKQNADSRQASGDIARLCGARFLNVSEPPKKMIFDAALLKSLLGRDTIVARHLHEREFEFAPVFKLFMNTNYLPLIHDDTLFASGRLQVITFDRHFSEAEQDKTLKSKLREEEALSGILNWCLEGLKGYYAEGLTPPAAVVEATREYRRDSDKLGKFIADCLEPAEVNITASSAYQIYEQWCRGCGYGCENRGNFFAELRGKNLLSKSGTVEGKTKLRVIKGYRFAAEWQPLFSA